MTKQHITVVSVLVALAIAALPLPSHADPLLIHRGPVDFTANRADVEVLGWTPSWDQLAVVAIDIHRFPRGAHKGSGMLLTFKIGEVIPLDNVNLLSLTQPDLPHDPVPLPSASDSIWGAGFALWKVFSHHPKEKHPPGWIEIEPLWEVLPEAKIDTPPEAKRTFKDSAGGETAPAEAASDGDQDDSKDADKDASDNRPGPRSRQMDLKPQVGAPMDAVPREVDASRSEHCRAVVGFMLKWKNQRRYQPHQALEVIGKCKYLHYTDHVTVWGKPDLGAVAIRFEFSPSPQNENSVRFPLSAAWSLGHALQLHIQTDPHAKAKAVGALKTIAGHYGKVTQTASKKSLSGRTIFYPPGLHYLAERIARETHGAFATQLDAKAGAHTLRIVYGSENKAAPVPAAPTTDGQPKAPANNTQTEPGSEPSYIDDWSLE